MEQQSKPDEVGDHEQHELEIKWRKAKAVALSDEVAYLRHITNKLEKIK